MVRWRHLCHESKEAKLINLKAPIVATTHREDLHGAQ